MIYCFKFLGYEDIIKKAVTKETRLNAQGQERTIVREVIETKDAEGNVNTFAFLRKKEMFLFLSL